MPSHSMAFSKKSAFHPLDKLPIDGLLGKVLIAHERQHERDSMSDKLLTNQKDGMSIPDTSVTTPSHEPSETLKTQVSITGNGLLTAKEVASLLRCHVSTVYDLIDGGRLAAFSLKGATEKGKRGKKGIRILSSSVESLIQAGIAEYALQTKDAFRWRRKGVGIRRRR